MSDKTEVTVNGGGGWIAFAIFLLACAGSPDLWDATMYYLTGNECYLEGAGFYSCTPGERETETEKGQAGG